LFNVLPPWDKTREYLIIPQYDLKTQGLSD